MTDEIGSDVMSMQARTIVTRPRGQRARLNDADARSEVRAWRGLPVAAIVTVAGEWRVTS